jgi:hypothetical protein
MMRSIVERIGFASLRLAASCTTAAGAALATAAIATGSFGAETLTTVIRDAFAVAAAMALAGGATLYLAGKRLGWLQDGPVSHASVGSGFSGWLVLLPLVLLIAPPLMLIQLRPLAEFWRDVLGLADRLGLWENLQGDTGFSGVVLMPIAAALAVPGLEALTAVMHVVGASFLLALLALRSTRVPRALLLCVLLQGALVLPCAFGASAIERATPSIEQLIRETPDPSGLEQARVSAALQRYVEVTRRASIALTWPWVAMAVWLPIVLFSARARATFAAPVPLDDRAYSPARLDPANLSAMNDRARARAYVDAARHIDDTTPPSRWF